MGAGVAQCSRGVDYRPPHLGGSRHEATQKLRHSYEAYETIWRRPPAALGQQGEPALYKNWVRPPQSGWQVGDNFDGQCGACTDTEG